MRKILSLAAALGVVASASALAQTGSVTGKVVDAEGKPLNRAIIKVTGTSRGGYSKADGSFLIGNVPVGSWSIRVSYAGMQDVVQTVRVGLEQTVDMGTVRLAKVGVGVVIGVTDTRTGTRTVKTDPGKIDRRTGEDILRTSRGGQSALASAALGASASTTQGNLAVRGMRTNDLSLRVDGVEQSDQFTGGAGNNNLTPSVLGLEEVQTVASGSDASKASGFGGGVEMVTRAGKNNRYEGAVQWITPLEFLYGSSSPITVKKAGTDIDTTLPGYKLQASGTQRYEFFFAGPIPGVDILTFSLSGKVLATPGSGGYEIYDMSPEFAQQRAAIADRVWGYHLNPQNISDLPNSEALTRQFNAKFRLQATDLVALEFSGELGLARGDASDWSNFYMYDTAIINGVAVPENIAQNLSSNEVRNRAQVKYIQILDENGTSSFDVSASYFRKLNEVGKRDHTTEPGFFGMYDIYQPVDADGDGVIDRYFSPVETRALNPYLVDRDPSNVASVPDTNALTGFIEGGENAGASHNPFGLTDGNFPAHGNSRSLEFREQEEIAFRGNYQTDLALSDSVTARIQAGGELSLFTLRRHSNSLPWDGNPFFDVYGYEAPYFLADSTGQLKEFFSKPYKPLRGAAYLSTRFGYKSIFFSPSVRFDFTLPNTKTAPVNRFSLTDIVNGFDALEDASMKFQISPRVGVSYPITDNSTFRVNFSLAYKFPEFNLLYDAAFNDLQRGSQIIGNPDIKPQKSLIYEIGFNTNFLPNFSLDLSAFYRDIYNQSGLTFVPALPNPYSIYTVTEYGNVRGLEVTLRKSLSDNFFAELNYTLQSAVGTASSPGANYATIIGSVDPYTGERQLPPLVEYPLDYDQTHKLSFQAGVVWGNNEGPSIAGLNLLENTTISMTATYGSGLPYTLENLRGQQISDYNALRLPAAYNTEARIERGIPIGDFIGDSTNSMKLSIFLDIFNVFNQTGPAGIYLTRSGAGRYSALSSPDNNGTSLDRQLGDFVGTTYYADIVPERPETWAANQYDNYGRRFYNPYADANLDGELTLQERYEGYQRFVATVQSSRGNYYQPRTVQLGLRLTF